MQISFPTRLPGAVISLLFISALASCGGGDDGSSDDDRLSLFPSPTPTLEPTRAPPPAPYPVPTPIPTPSPTALPTPMPTATPGPTGTPTPPPTPTPSPTPSPTPTPVAGSLAQIQVEIFNVSCAVSGCHVGGAPAGGLLLNNEANSYDNLVGAVSLDSPLNRVEPGEPDESYLVELIESTGSDRMPPPPAPALSNARITTIRDWITNGAPETGTGTAPTSLSKVSVLNTAGVEFILRFSRDIQQETLNEDAVQVYFLSANNQRLASLEDYDLIVSNRELIVDIPLRPSDATAVQLVVNEPGLSSVLDANGRIIDGDRDQLDGGVFRYTYSF